MGVQNPRTPPLPNTYLNLVLTTIRDHTGVGRGQHLCHRSQNIRVYKYYFPRKHDEDQQVRVGRRSPHVLSSQPLIINIL